MRIIGLWLWLESLGFPNIVVRLLSLPDMILNLMANEAVDCLNALERGGANTNININVTPNSNNYEQPLFTRRILNSTVISFSFFNEYRISAIRSITKFLNDVGTRVFDDIIQKTVNHRYQLFHSIFGADGGALNFNLRPAATPFSPVTAGPSNFESFTNAYAPPPPPPRTDTGLGLWSGRETSWNLAESDVKGKQVMVGLGLSQRGLQTPSFPSPFTYSHSQFVIGGPSSSTSPALLPQDPTQIAAADTTENPLDGRTLFITFSRGYPITETELRTFLTMNHGDCVESIYMQEVQQPYVQALFARVVIKSAMIMDIILQEADDEGKAKFVINGKHAWARKYFPKETNH